MVQEIFRKLFQGGVQCPACEGKGRLEKPEKEYAVVFGTSPENADPPELAVALLLVASVTLAKKMGVDPATVKVNLKFGATGHRVEFTLQRGTATE